MKSINLSLKNRVIKNRHTDYCPGLSVIQVLNRRKAEKEKLFWHVAITWSSLGLGVVRAI